MQSNLGQCFLNCGRQTSSCPERICRGICKDLLFNVKNLIKYILNTLKNIDNFSLRCRSPRKQRKYEKGSIVTKCLRTADLEGVRDKNQRTEKLHSSLLTKSAKLSIHHLLDIAVWTSASFSFSQLYLSPSFYPTLGCEIFSKIAVFVMLSRYFCEGFSPYKNTKQLHIDHQTIKEKTFLSGYIELVGPDEYPIVILKIRDHFVSSEVFLN